MKKLIPKLVYDNIFQIKPEILLKRNIRAMLIDLDGTMASRHTPKPDVGLQDFLKQFIDADIKVVVFSNNNKKRVSVFCDSLGVLYISKARKPFSQGFKTAQKLLNIPFEQLAVVGDQIFTDVFGGNRHGALTIFVESIDKKDFIIRVRYQFERWFIRLGKKQLESWKK